jgi:transcriptional regulator with XRE-family HTH domain
MASRVQIEGSRRAVTVARTLAEDLRRLREDAGVSQRALARASGVDQSVISRAEADLEVPGLETYARLAAALGADLSARLYPNTGPAIRDRHQARIVRALIRGLHDRWRVWPEIGVRQPVRGWIDAVLVDANQPLAVATEVESSLTRLEQAIRWSTAKADALDSSRAWPFGVAGQRPVVDRLLVVRATRATREVAEVLRRNVASCRSRRSLASTRRIARSDTLARADPPLGTRASRRQRRARRGARPVMWRP